MLSRILSEERCFRSVGCRTNKKSRLSSSMLLAEADRKMQVKQCFLTAFHKSFVTGLHAFIDVSSYFSCFALCEPDGWVLGAGVSPCLVVAPDDNRGGSIALFSFYQATFTNGPWFVNPQEDQRVDYVDEALPTSNEKERLMFLNIPFHGAVLCWVFEHFQSRGARERYKISTRRDRSLSYENE